MRGGIGWQRLLRLCAPSCAGEGRVLRCLEGARREGDFGEACAEALVAALERAAGDYRLNYGLREACAADVGLLCAYEKEAIELAEGYGADSQVITCLEVSGVERVG